MLILIGAIIGLVVGLTGAGGALVSIPLFMQFQGMSLKEASVFSLVAVIVASFSNLIFQRKDAQIPLASLFIITSAIGSLISEPFKNLLSDIYLALTLAAISIYSLYSVWVPVKASHNEEQLKVHPLKTVFIGLILGLLTTFTGLGGGVLILPLLLKVYQFEQKKAVATSLVVIGFSSLASFLIQVSKGSNLKIDLSFIGLFMGISITSYLLKLLIERLPTKASTNLRKIVFTIVVGLSLAKIFS